jgi:hypothetical protein
MKGDNMTLRAIVDSKAVLNHVLNLQRFSLANYLRFARPWACEPDHVLLTVVFGIARVQQEHVTRVGKLLVERHASAEPGSFPMRFTGLNDLSIRYVAPLVVDDLERIIHDLRCCAEALRDDGPALALVQAILRDEERHLQVLGDELRHTEQEPSTAPQWASIRRGDKSTERDVRQRSSAEDSNLPQPA